MDQTSSRYDVHVTLAPEVGPGADEDEARSRQIASALSAVARRVAADGRSPLTRDAYALVLNSGATAAAGLLYWIIAATDYSPQTTGLNAALISGMTFLAGFASLDLANLVVGLLPRSVHPARLILRSYTVSAVLGAIAAAIFVVGVRSWAPKLSSITATGWLVIWFIISTAAWCVFVIQDGVLTGLGRTVWVPIENAVFSILKLGLLVGLAASFPQYGILVSWTAAMLIAVAGVSVLIFTRFVRRTQPRVARRAGSPASPRTLSRYFATDYLTAMAWLAASNLVLVVVAATAGPAATAYVALPWAVALPLYLISANIGSSLVLHASENAAGLPSLLRAAVKHALWLIVPGVLVIVALAPQILSLFGRGYPQHGALALRLFAVGALPNLVLALSVSVGRATQRMGFASFAMMAFAGVSLGALVPLVHAAGPSGAGMAWLGAQVFVAVGILGASRLPVVRIGRDAPR